MKFKKGDPKPPNSGKKAGQQNKATIEGKARVEAYGKEAIEFHHAVMTNTLPCGVCRGLGKTKYQPGGSEDGKPRTCQSCWNSKMERIDPKVRQASAESLLDRFMAKLKHVEHSGTVDHEITQGYRLEVFDLAKYGAKR